MSSTSTAFIAAPEGWASQDRKFNLKKMMALQNDNKLYREIVHTVESNAKVAGLNILKDIWNQDLHELRRVLDKGRAQFPYLTLERFPNDWAQIAILQAYFRNQRNALVRDMFRRMHAISDGSSVA
ncbi:hypothetical protein AB1N83_002494 [Pleurotus pulmonarius]